MSLTFLHTADWQLGKPYQRVADPTKRARLQTERLACLRRVGDAARESGSAFVLVAGDLFDSPTPLNATVAAACEAIGSMNIPVLAIPGNHDYGGPGSLWEQPFFLHERDQRAPNLRILLTPEPVILDQAVLFPAPLLRRHTPTDPTAWIRSAVESADLPRDRPRLILAHGSVQGFESSNDDEDEETTGVNRIDLTRLPNTEIDYIALGDWHGTRMISPKAWYAGTPEIDRFPKGADNDPGHVLIVRATRGQPPHIEPKPTGHFRWNSFSHHFSEDAGFEAFGTALDTHIGTWGQDSLLKLTLTGSLGIEMSQRLAQRLTSLEALLLRVKLDDRVTIAPTAEEIQNLADRPADPLIASVATRLIEMSHSSDRPEIARLALRELHAALQ
jgi:DNA repair exonuclease SbcCD nuclease subunit